MLLNRILRSCLAPSGRRPRSYRPSIDGLEFRKLLDGGVQLSYIWNDGAQPPTVGGHFDIQVTKENGLPYDPGTIASTTWTITGAYSGYSMDSVGYHTNPLGVVTVAGDTVSGYWDEHAGQHAVGVTVQFVQPTWMGIPIVTQWPQVLATTINIDAPTVTTQTKFGSINLVNTSYSSTLVAGSLATLTPGFHSNIDVTTPNGVGGTFGVVQTLDPTLKYYKNINGSSQEFDGFVSQNGVPSGTILDRLPTSDLPYYNGKVNVGQTLVVDDTPQTSMNDPRTYRMIVNDKFTDTVMYTPPGGIPVPIATTSWAYGATVVRSSTGTPIISPFTPKTDPGFVPGPTGQTGWVAGGTIPFPQWNGKVTDYLNYGSPTLTQVPLSGTDTTPDPGLAMYWYSIGDPYNYYDPYDDRDSQSIG